MPAANERAQLIERIRKSSSVLEPIPTGMPALLDKPQPIRAVVFDIYGTLFVSGSGDVGTHAATDSAHALTEAMLAAGVHGEPAAGKRGVQLLDQAIEAAHEQRRSEGVAFPEVDIRVIWQQVLQTLAEEEIIRWHTGRRVELGKAVFNVAVEYECRVNPVWPMPSLAEVLAALREREMRLGLVSNAQFVTPLLFEAFLGRPYEDLGFTGDFCRFSYRMLEAKPSRRAYEEVAEALADRGVERHEILYVGNDVRNDVEPAAAVGFKTALFAGDKRSLRLREGDPHVQGVKPDLVLTDLKQLLEVVAG